MRPACRHLLRHPVGGSAWQSSRPEPLIARAPRKQNPIWTICVIGDRTCSFGFSSQDQRQARRLSYATAASPARLWAGASTCHQSEAPLEWLSAGRRTDESRSPKEIRKPGVEFQLAARELGCSRGNETQTEGLKARKETAQQRCLVCKGKVWIFGVSI